MYAASEACSSALRVFGEGSMDAECVSVDGMRWVPRSVCVRLECRAWVWEDMEAWKGPLFGDWIL